MKNQSLFTMEEELLLDSLKNSFSETLDMNTIFLELSKIQNDNPKDSFLEDSIESLKEKLISSQLSILDLKELCSSFQLSISESDMENIL